MGSGFGEEFVFVVVGDTLMSIMKRPLFQRVCYGISHVRRFAISRRVAKSRNVGESSLRMSACLAQHTQNTRQVARDGGRSRLVSRDVGSIIDLSLAIMFLFRCPILESKHYQRQNTFIVGGLSFLGCKRAEVQGDAVRSQ